MMRDPFKHIVFAAGRRRRGVALVLAAILLAVCATLLATLSIGMTMAKRRLDYQIEYQRARYALDSAAKYARTVLPEKTFSLAERDGLPDFSDQFWMTPQEQTAYLTRWLAEAAPEAIEKALKPSAASGASGAQPLTAEDFLARLSRLFGLNAQQTSSSGQTAPASPTALTDREPVAVLPDGREVRVQDLRIPGPYRADWPLVQEPIELDISQAQVRITIEDENAKLPLTWLVAVDETLRKNAMEALTVFCDWMGYDKDQRKTLQEQLAVIAAKKQFEINPSPILLTVNQPASSPQQTPPTAASRRRRSRRTAEQQQQQSQPAPTQTVQRPASGHAADFAKLFHSALLDQDLLARPAIRRSDADVNATAENPLRFLALWGSQRVNINTAPRPVLEAALSIGGMAEEAAEQIIRQRQKQPFKDIDELKNRLWQYNSIFDKTKDLLTTESNFFLIRIRAASGNAVVWLSQAVIKEGNKVEPLVTLYGY